MLIHPVPKNSIWQNNLQATPSPTLPGTALTANSTIHTKATSYTTLIDPTTYDSYGFWLLFSGSSATGTATAQLCDIAIGAASSEVVIVPNIQCGWRGSPNNVGAFAQFFPIFIPRGSRVSARIQALISSDTVSCAIWLVGGVQNTSPLFVGCDLYGVDTANSRGTLHTPGATGTESADANVGGTTSRAYGAVSIEVGLGALSVANSRFYFWELTIGGTTICEWLSFTHQSELISCFFPLRPFHISIPASTQLQVQAECSGTAQQHDVQFRCFY